MSGEKKNEVGREELLIKSKGESLTELQSREISKISKWENRRKYVAFNL